LDLKSEQRDNSSRVLVSWFLKKIDARNGAFGLLADECDNAIITGNFWAFDADHARLSSAFFDYLRKTPLFVEFCVRASEGTTNRRYLQEGKFLAQEIPLPPLAGGGGWWRVVARIEELAAQNSRGPHPPPASRRGMRSTLSFND